ncbi:hypothetical protein NEICINOT_04916 [Neisseria cinerea ATCC 14685]|uniref:Uncharacterized protein n=1 Tax=Neisseria cinerea ATCC 14685 TaxID=546262 RepID=D0W5F3_NEICI|nr:hypothetical protein NEICINOT_04916 [Neisseria cinerea ATCC 14685]
MCFSPPFLHFCLSIGRLKSTLRLIRLLIRFPQHPNHAAPQKTRARCGNRFRHRAQ